MDELNLGTAWERVADHRGDAPALFHGRQSRSWTDFENRSARLAGALAAAGVDAGDNVACALFNGNEYLEAEFAALKRRAAPVNINYRYVEQELAYLVDNSDAKAVFVDHALVERFDNIVSDLSKVRLWVHVGDGECPAWAARFEDLIDSHEPDPRMGRSSQDLWILYTGGTTGHPKGVMWPHESIITLINRPLSLLDIALPQSPDDLPAMLDAIDRAGAAPRQLAAAPLMHGTAGIGALYTLFQGGSVVTLPSRKFDAHELWQTVQDVGVTTISLVGDVFCSPMVDALDESSADGKPFDLSSVKRISSSGVMWSQPVKDRLLAHAHDAGCELTLVDSLGASEGVGFGAKASADGDDTETATFTLGPNAALFSEDGRRIKPGSDEAGLLAVTGPIPLGYYGDPEKSAETFREMDGQRWSVPGDWARVAADGTVSLLGRGSVSINTGGEKVYPEEIEEALKLHPEVLDANVVGVPDPKWGAAVTAVVELVTAATVSDADLIESLRTHLAGYKLPKAVVRVDEIFRGPNGKADYKWATATAIAAVAAVEPTPPT